MTGAQWEDDKWTEGQVPYDGKSRRAILGKVLELAIVKVFGSNVYKFAGKIYLQTDGARIGLDLSGEIGRLVMALYDVTFMELCDANKVHMDLNQRYVDGDDLVQPAIPRGYRLNNKAKIAFKQVCLEEDKDGNLANAERTMNIMVNLANTIDSNIVMMGDCPSKHEMGRVPMLDLDIFMEKQEPDVNTSIGRFKWPWKPIRSQWPPS